MYPQLTDKKLLLNLQLRKLYWRLWLSTKCQQEKLQRLEAEDKQIVAEQEAAGLARHLQGEKEEAECRIEREKQEVALLKKQQEEDAARKKSVKDLKRELSVWRS